VSESQRGVTRTQAEQLDLESQDFEAMKEYGKEVEAAAVDFRAKVPSGTYLGESSLGERGATARWRKSPSLMRAGVDELPVRVPLYDRVDKHMSMVPPTIATARLNKDRGRYSIAKPEGWDEAQPKPIGGRCDICDARRAREGKEPRLWYDEMTLETHIQNRHPAEWDKRERDRDRAERKEQQDLLRMMVENQTALLRNQGPARRNG
jgi:hypothetical protein